MWEGLEVSSRELKKFPNELWIFLEGLNFFNWRADETFSKSLFFL